MPPYPTPSTPITVPVGTGTGVGTVTKVTPVPTSRQVFTGAAPVGTRPEGMAALAGLAALMIFA